jgi:hypothetical protein
MPTLPHGPKEDLSHLGKLGVLDSDGKQFQTEPAVRIWGKPFLTKKVKWLKSIGLLLTKLA